ncbi:hypothetical protein [Nocardia sp. NPDC051463]|uniref:hypothetical protein n=1 Tax=Nocardia sp. NPDC051463 TaxID=3154845 RepID=UPI00344D4B3B
MASVVGRTGERMENAGPSTSRNENDQQREGSRPSEGPWAKVGGIAGALGVVAAVIFGIPTCSSNPSPASLPARSETPTSTTILGSTVPVAPVILGQGHQKLENVQGLDLDTGQIHDQDKPGVDVSPSKSADGLNAMSNGTPRFAVLGNPAAGSSTHERCREIAAGSWTKTLSNLYALHVGDTICVRTDQGNLAAMTLVHIPSVAEQYLDVDFTTWRDR